MGRLEEAVQALAEDLELPRSYIEGVLRSLGLASRIVSTQEDLTACVSIEFYHGRPGRTVLTSKAPEGLVIHPAEQRAVAREERER